MLTLSLPWPPSVNTYWRHPTSGKLTGRHLISADGRSYRTAVQLYALSTKANKQIKERLSIKIDAYPPDRRRRDLDNILKSLFDSLVHASVIEDDSQFDRIVVTRCPVSAGHGKVVVTLEPMETYV